MVTSTEPTLIKNIKLSSVGPGHVTGSDVIHEPNGMDLAMKLHYLFGIYVFKSHAMQNLTVKRIKESMFYWLNDYYVTCGRFRRSESGRPYLKCNDCGVRFIEAQCEKTVDEWLEMEDHSLDKQLVYHLPIGPQLSFSPPLYIQITWFKCGGMSLGLSWAHVLGDVFSVSQFMNNWSHFLATFEANVPHNLTKSPSLTARIQRSELSPTIAKPKDQLSIKRVDPVGDHWVVPNNCKMDSFSFHVTANQIAHLKSKISSRNPNYETIPVFESLCSIIWQCVAQVRDGSGPNTVTICKSGSQIWKKGELSNSQIIRCVEADFSIIEASLGKLAALLVSEGADETIEIEEAMERDKGVPDFIVYGANLTFVNMEDVDIYGVELKAEFVSYGIQGVGDEGVVLVLPDARDFDKDSSEFGRFLTITLPEDQMLKLKPKLKKNGLLVETHIE